MAVLTATNLTKIYRGQRGAVAVRALEAFSLTVEPGEFVAVMGPSGSGKTTLLNVLGTIDKPTSGDVQISGVQVERLTGRALSLFRQRRLGFIFQHHHLLDFLSLRENILLPLALQQLPSGPMEEQVRTMAGRLGIAGILDRFPYEVSGGEAQRAAAARALVHAPALVLADEPTGNLDSRSARDLMEALADLNQERKATILMVTHDPASASHCSRVIFIKDGRLFTEVRPGGERRQFFHQILDVLAVMGGDMPDLLYHRH